MERIGDTVGRELARGGGEMGAALAEITAVWPKAVGEVVARQAWPLRLARDGTLHVATASSTWAFELDRLSPEIAGRLAVFLGDSVPPKFRFRVGPIPEPGAAPEANEGATQEVVERTPESDSEADSAASAIDDPELRRLVARAASASLARARSGRQF
jgi:predicted nucleic acid-binding Zn ribbon protein